MFLSKINQPIILIYLLKLPTFDKLIRNKTSWTMNEPLFLSIKNIHTMPRNSIFNCMWKAKNMLLGWRSLWQCKTVGWKEESSNDSFFFKNTLLAKLYTNTEEVSQELHQKCGPLSAQQCCMTYGKTSQILRNL